jgi:hypothetical protein
LRQLPIHPDLVAELWCPHWTVRPPRLPSLNSLAPAEAERYGREEQLSLAAVLAES